MLVLFEPCETDVPVFLVETEVVGNIDLEVLRGCEFLEHGLISLVRTGTLELLLDVVSGVLDQTNTRGAQHIAVVARTGIAVSFLVGQDDTVVFVLALGFIDLDADEFIAAVESEDVADGQLTEVHAGVLWEVDGGLHGLPVSGEDDFLGVGRGSTIGDRLQASLADASDV
ncbi:MAG: hypothetical protein [Podoviridae sp. ctda_1]|nr:MAG: hypothetical protein [Podoviridae sp. ctda_1]